MPDHETSPPLISELCALARDQLKTQAARSTALEASSLGIIAFGGTFATIALTFGRTPQTGADLPGARGRANRSGLNAHRPAPTIGHNTARLQGRVSAAAGIGS